MTKISFRKKITLIACLITALILLGYFALTALKTYEESQKMLYEKADLMSDMQAQSLSSAMWNYDKEVINNIIRTYKRDADFYGLEVYDENGTVSAIYYAGARPAELITIPKAVIYDLKGELNKIGEVKLYLRKDKILNDLRTQISYSIAAFILIIGAVSLSLYYSFKYMTKPLSAITEAIEKYGKGERDVVLPIINSNDEISTLAKTFGEMRTEIDSFTGSLEKLVNIRTEQLEKTLEKLEASNEAKSKFLASFSHELRTPLNSVIAYSEFIMDELMGPLGSEIYLEYSRNINASGQHLLDIINDILDLSKAEAGKLVIVMQEMNLEQSIRESAKYIEKKAADNGVKIILDIEFNMPPFIADYVRFKQIMLNLLSNSVKFTGNDGQIKITASSKKLSNGKPEFTIKVADSGIGMTPEQAAYAFETYTQVDTDNVRAAQGTGLGLPLTKHLVELMGGTIEMESAPNVGTTAILKFVCDSSLLIDGSYIKEFTLQ